MDVKKTLHAAYRGYVVQAVINNLAPVLFLTFVGQYNIPLIQISVLIVVNFGTQIAADVFSVFFMERLGTRFCAIMSHLCAAAGLWLMALLPGIVPSPFVGLVIAVMVCAWGGGLLEVLVSPIVDAMPLDAKAAGMSLLHSFYSWGQVAVVLVSTLLLCLLPVGLWWILPLAWSLLPLLNTIAFARVPLPEMKAGREESGTLGGLLRNKLFWLLLVLMIMAGASEQGMAQWSSAFAEAGLGVDKTLGDLLGPMLFGVFMALGRTWYGLKGDRIPLRRVLVALSLLCVACYLTAALAPWPFVALAGCALCGLAVSLFWPGITSLAAANVGGGAPMFGLLAILGDVGCSLGPWVVGAVAGAAGGAASLSWGLLTGTAFPAVMLVGMLLIPKSAKQE